MRRIEFVRAAAGERYGGLDVESSPYFTEITDDPETVLAGCGEVDGHRCRPAARPSQRADRLVGKRCGNAAFAPGNPRRQLRHGAAVADRILRARGGAAARALSLDRRDRSASMALQIWAIAQIAMSAQHSGNEAAYGKADQIQRVPEQLRQLQVRTHRRRNPVHAVPHQRRQPGVELAGARRDVGRVRRYRRRPRDQGAHPHRDRRELQRQLGSPAQRRTARKPHLSGHARRPRDCTSSTKRPGMHGISSSTCSTSTCR